MLTLTEIVQDLLRPRIPPGSVLVDATAGNGNDTLFLARCAGSGGYVHAFDIQEVAINRTTKRLEEAGLAGRVRLYQQNHRDMAQCIAEKDHGRLRAVMFNLGYLPDSDHSITTKSGDTLKALEVALSLLMKGGLISILCYRGHPGGEDEAKLVDEWTRSLEPVEFEVLEVRLQNRLKSAPFGLIIRKSR